MIGGSVQEETGIGRGAGTSQAGTAAPPRHRPAHHVGDGTFRNPWPTAAGGASRAGAFWRWRWDRLLNGVEPDRPGSLPLVRPELPPAGARYGELHLTWIGHSTLLIQLDGVNILTDPVWSRRVSPVSWLGPARHAPPGLPFDELPPIDAVLLSHDHYDHLDDPTVRRLADRFGERIRWFTSLGYADWLARRGIHRVTELDWWDDAALAGPLGTLRIGALPAQHWCRRSPADGLSRLWASWSILAPSGLRVYFGGDSGYFPEYGRIGAARGPFDLMLLPIGAYEPEWFMRAAHMNPDEAVLAYRDLGATGLFVPIHWGTFRLSDEPLIAPPRRLRDAWRNAGLPPDRLAILRHGETRVLTARAARAARRPADGR